MTKPTKLWLAVLVGMAAIVVAASIAHWPALEGKFIWDDESLIANNYLVTAPEGWYRMWVPGENIDYWPVTNDSFWIEWQLWGANTTGYHVDNLLLHIADSLLIWLILRRLSIPGAFFAALLFAVHPVNVESVAWIAQRKNTLALLFFLLSIFLYFECPGQLNRGYWASVLTFVLGMLSKGSIAILPLVLLIIAWWKQGRITRAELLRTAPFFLAAAVLVGMNIWSQQHAGTEPIRSITIAERVADAGAVVWFYLSKAVWPAHLLFVYPQLAIDPGHLPGWLPLMAAVSVTAVLVWQRRRPWCRAILFAWAYFCVALLPVMGFTDVYYMKYSLVADHYQYVALIGIAALAAACWAALEQAGAKSRWVAITTASAAVVVLTLMSRHQSELYSDPVMLYEDTLQLNPDSWLVHNNLGGVLNNTHRPAEAQTHLEAAAHLSPQHVEIHYNLGNAAMLQGNLPEAIEHYRDAIQVDPKYPEAYYGLGQALQNTGHLAEAIDRYRQATQLEPGYTQAHFALGSALLADGQAAAAAPEFETAIEQHPEFFPARIQWGNALLMQGRFEESIGQFRAAVQQDDQNAHVHNSLGAALQSAGRHAEALAEFTRATQLDPDNADAWGNLAAVLDQLHQPTQAVVAANTALKLARLQNKAALVAELESWLQAHAVETTGPQPQVPQTR